MDLQEKDIYPRNKSFVGLSIIGTVDTLVVTLYFLLVLCIGLWALVSHNRGTIKDFFLAGQNLAWWLVGSSLFSANIGSGHFMGLAGIGASSGIAFGAFEWNTVFMIFVLGWIFVPMYDNAGVVTLPEYLRKRFGSVRLQLLFSVTCLLFYIFMSISVEICFGAMFLKMVLDIDIYQTMMVILTIVGIYTVTGGLTAVAYAEAFQAVIMVLGSALLTGSVFNAVGGYQGLTHKYFQAIPSLTHEGNWTAKPKCYTPRPDAFHIFRNPVSGDIPWPGLLLGGTTVSLFYGCADQVSVQRFLAGRSMLHMKGGCILCGYLKLLPMFFMVMPGMISRILFSDQVACVVPSECKKFCGSQTGCTTMAYPVLVTKVMPSGLQGFMLSTVCASLMSTLTSVFNSSSALFTMNIYTWIRPLSTEKELMIAGRFFTIILLAITIVWIPIIESTHNEKLFEYFQILKSCLTPSTTAAFLLAVFCKRVNEQGTFWGMIVGTTVGIVRLLAEIVFGSLNCEGTSKCPVFVCGLHYLYFSVLLFVFTLLIILGISLVTEPIPDEYLYGICWSLRNSREKRESLEMEMTWKRLPSLTYQPGMFGEAHTCFWKFWNFFCGLDSQPYSKVAPENISEESGDAAKKETEIVTMSQSAEILALKEAIRRGEETRKMNDREWNEIPDKPSWRRVVNACGILLFVLLVAVHIYFA